jgi:hypothetical protein
MVALMRFALLQRATCAMARMRAASLCVAKAIKQPDLALLFALRAVTPEAKDTRR